IRQGGSSIKKLERRVHFPDTSCSRRYVPLSASARRRSSVSGVFFFFSGTGDGETSRRAHELPPVCVSYCSYRDPASTPRDRSSVNVPFVLLSKKNASIKPLFPSSKRSRFFQVDPPSC